MCAAGGQSPDSDVGPAPWRTGLRLRDFAGVVYPPAPKHVRSFGVGWTRKDFSWNAIEPENDRWEWKKTDRLVLECHARGLEILPILAYTAKWAASKPGDGCSPPRNVEDWTDFVEHVVARYSAPPFRLRYYQVWNEPTKKAGFWHGTNEEFIDRVYLPAAAVIRRHGGRVVFGGWPCSNSIDELDAVLRYRDAWAWTDIIDVHYNENRSWGRLWDEWVRPGKCLGLWQTEIGFNPFPNYLPNCYLRALHWALRRGWNQPEQYKMFWFAAWGAGKDAAKCLTGPVPGNRAAPTEHGKRLAVLNQVLGGGDLSVWTGFTASPSFPPALQEEVPVVLGFRVGRDRRVVALLLDVEICRTNPRNVLTLEDVADAKSARVRLLTVLGEERPCPIARPSGKIRVEAPVGVLKAYRARGWGRPWDAVIAYLVVDMADRRR